ncbi:unnamed protein product [Boreogadus saida]
MASKRKTRRVRGTDTSPVDNLCPADRAGTEVDLPLVAADDSSDSPEPEPFLCMEPLLVRRLSCRTLQLPPLAFRQAEQYYYAHRPEADTALPKPPRPTTLPLRTPPLIAITAADTER